MHVFFLPSEETVRLFFLSLRLIKQTVWFELEIFCFSLNSLGRTILSRSKKAKQQSVISTGIPVISHSISLEKIVILKHMRKEKQQRNLCNNYDYDNNNIE